MALVPMVIFVLMYKIVVTECTSQSHNEVIDQFKEIETDLNSFSTAFHNPQSCKIPKRSLINLKTEIQNTLDNSSTHNEVRCELNLNTTNNCQELISMILCGIHHIKNNYIMGTSQDDSTKFKNEYDNILRVFENNLDDLKQSIENKYLININELQTKIQDLLLKIERSNQRLKQMTKELCILQIQVGNIDAAVSNFRNLNVSVLEVVKLAYTDNKYLDKVLYFLLFLELGFIEETQSSETWLFEEMKNKGYLNDYTVVDIFNSLDFFLLVWFYSLKFEIIPYLKSALIRIADHPDEFYDKGERFVPHIDIIIGTVYSGDIRNYHKVLNYINYLHEEHQVDAYIQLIREMKDSKSIDSYEFIRLVYLIKNNRFYHYMRSEIPSAVLNLVEKGHECQIYNVVYGEYLYPSKFSTGRYSNQRLSYTWRPKNSVFEGDFKISSSNNGDTFTIYSLYWKEYLYAALDEHKHDGKWRRVFTWMEGTVDDQCYWKIKPIAEGTQFFIYNTRFGEYLYASSRVNDNDRRMIYTEYYYSSESVWKIIC